MESIISQIEGFFKLSRVQLLLGKLETYLLPIFLPLLMFFLVGTAFFLGRATKFMENRPVFVLEMGKGFEGVVEKEKGEVFGAFNTSTATIVASTGGKKYYYVWCKGAANLKENKKRYFNTEEEAKHAGYTLAANCK